MMRFVFYAKSFTVNRTWERPCGLIELDLQSALTVLVSSENLFEKAGLPFVLEELWLISWYPLHINIARHHCTSSE